MQKFLFLIFITFIPSLSTAQNLISEMQGPSWNQFLSAQGLSESDNNISLFFENLYNKAFVHEKFKLKIEHFEIPFDWVDQNLLKKIEPRILKHITINKNGKKFIKWFIYPESLVYKYGIANLLQEYGYSNEIHQEFTGYLTASRSLIIEFDDYQLSVKISTDRLLTKFSESTVEVRKQNKGHTFTAARTDLTSSEVLKEMFRQINPQKIRMVEEEGYLNFKSSLKEYRSPEYLPAMSFRDASYFKRQTNGNLLIPGFAFGDKRLSEFMTRLYELPSEFYFFDKVLIPIMGESLSELFGNYGAVLDSPHLQNILFEVNSEGKLTGVIAIRDVGDIYFSHTYLEKFGIPQNKQNLIQVKDTSQSVEFWPFGAVSPERNAPDWLTPDMLNSLAKTFFINFRKKLMNTKNSQNLYIEKTGQSASGFTLQFKSKIQIPAFLVVSCQNLFL